MEVSSISEYELPLSNGQKLLAEINGLKIVDYNGEISLLNSQGISMWSSPFKFEGKANQAFISKDRLLLTTDTNDYHAWGILGPAFLIDLKDGSLVAKLRGESGASLKNGSFILGLEGYGCFKTWLYDRNGKLVQEWRSYGHYIVGENDDIRVLECDRRDPTESRLVRLKKDGQIEKGQILNDSQIGKPLVLGDSSIFFIDYGVIRIVDLNLKEQFKKVLMKISLKDSCRFNSYLQFKNKKILVDIYEETKSTSAKFTKHSWLIDFSYKS